MASCAACLQQILRSQQFVLDDTEVFHRACVGQRYRSKLRIAEQRAREVEAQLADTRRAAARVEDDLNRERNQATARGADVISLTSMLSSSRAQLVAAQDRVQAYQNELRAAQVENVGLRAELAAVKQEAPAERDDDLDASAQRFRMLELD